MPEQEEITLTGPTGMQIVGILQVGVGVSGVEHFYKPDDTGLYGVEWDGTTEWETQEDKLNDDLERVFVDEGGNEWSESEVLVVDASAEEWQDSPWMPLKYAKQDH